MAKQRLKGVMQDPGESMRISASGSVCTSQFFTDHTLVCKPSEPSLSECLVDIFFRCDFELYRHSFMSLYDLLSELMWICKNFDRKINHIMENGNYSYELR